MRNYNLQTPQKEQSVANRQSKSISDHLKKAQKATVASLKKNLNFNFSAFSEDILAFESPKDSIDFTLISENVDENLLTESAENVTASLSPATLLGSDVAASSHLTHLSSITISEEHKEDAAPTKQSRTTKSEIGKLSSIEAELVVKHLREAQLQIVNAADMDLKSKRVLVALVNLMVEELIQLPEEKDQFNKLMVRKGNLLFLSFLLWILLVSAVFFFFCGGQSSLGGVTPT